LSLFVELFVSSTFWGVCFGTVCALFTGIFGIPGTPGSPGTTGTPGTLETEGTTGIFGSEVTLTKI